jgi:hypothetical protein
MKKIVGMGCWVVGLGDMFEGEKGERKKLMFSKPIHPTHAFLLFLPSNTVL